MSGPIYGVYGASGCGRSVMPLARAQLNRLRHEARSLVFIDDATSSEWVNGHRVMTLSNFLAIEAPDRYVSIAIANSRVRARLADTLANAGIKPWSVQADNVVTMDEVVIGEGAIISPFVTLTSNLHIGKQFHANLYSYVEHDCVIGDFVTFAPGVHCNGNVHIADHVYIGAGAMIKQGMPGNPLIIGSGAVIGMGAVVTRSVPAGVTLVGNPARALKR